MKKIKIDFTPEMKDQIILQDLKTHLKYMKQDVKRVKAIKKRGPLQPFQQEDLNFFKETKRALKIMVKYYGG